MYQYAVQPSSVCLYSPHDNLIYSKVNKVKISSHRLVDWVSYTVVLFESKKLPWLLLKKNLKLNVCLKF